MLGFLEFLSFNSNVQGTIEAKKDRTVSFKSSHENKVFTDFLYFYNCRQKK